VVSVAGLEMAYNLTTNLLTRAMGMRSLAFQLFTMSAQSVAGGNVVINPGAFSLYRGWLIHRILPAYTSETFFGTPVTLGDDTALTLFALLHGRAVHQPTAVAMPVYPETLSHHLRQWTRWMRASTIRTLWRIRYLRPRSYAWWFVLYQQYAFFASVAVSLAVPFAWPATRNLIVASGVALVAWPIAVAMRLITVHRTDVRWSGWLASVGLLPFAALWYLLVLRQIRFYGMATCHRQGWITRKKVEVTLSGASVQPAEVLVNE
jgi:hyaluronan synthase